MGGSGFGIDKAKAPTVIGSADTGYFQWNTQTRRWESIGISVPGVVSNPLKLTDTQINQGMASAGDQTREKFLSRPIEEQQSFVFGEKSEFLGGRPKKLTPDKLQESKTKIKEDVEGGKIGTEEARKIIEDRELHPQDELELLLFLEDLKPPLKKRVGEFFKGFFGNLTSPTSLFE